MNFHRSEKFKKNFKKLPLVIKEAFYKQAEYLLKDIRHPSLHAKKYDETIGLWQARVTRDWRFYFLIQDDTYILTHIGSHPK